MSAPNRNTLWARALADELTRHGLRHVCVGSGSRSAPLVEAFVRDERLRVHPHIDERSAAFFALGLSVTTGVPAAVVTTSGTAAANLLPAVVEASQSDVPLLLLTADRPASLRGLDANQTIDQTRLFGTFVRAFIDLPLPRPRVADLGLLRVAAARSWAAARSRPPGPVHLNVQFEKPLEPVAVPGDVDPAVEEDPRGGGRADGPFTRTVESEPAPGGAPEPGIVRSVLKALESAARPVFVAGPRGDRRGARELLRLAAAVDAPVLADPLSGARFVPGAGEAVVPGADAVLADPAARKALEADLVIRFGPAPTSATVQAYLEERAGTPCIVLGGGSRWQDHGALASVYSTAGAGTLTEIAGRTAAPHGADPDWAPIWRELSGAAGAALEPALDAEWFEGAVAATVVRALPDGSTFFIGNSMPIRDVDAFAAPREVAVRTVGMRGASGIDGNVSAALGACVGTRAPTAALIGDLTLLHDVGALFAARDIETPCQLVVVQNRGGGIFHMLPIRDHDPPFTRHIVMPHDTDLAAVAAAAGIPHRLPASARELDSALTEGWEEPGIRLIEVRIDRERNHEARARVLEAARAAVVERLAAL